MTAQALADELAFSTRTVYRYIDDLSVSGIPIYSEAGVGYRLHEAFELRPLALTPDEFDVLLLASSTGEVNGLWVHGVDESVLLEASKKVDRDFLAHEEGILGHVLLRGRDGVYADLALADSQARAEEVCAKWTANAVALKYIELLDEESVDMTFWERMR